VGDQLFERQVVLRRRQVRISASVGVLVGKLPGAANAAVAAGHGLDRFPCWALSGVPKCYDGGALTRRYTTDCGSWQLPDTPTPRQCSATPTNTTPPPTRRSAPGGAERSLDARTVDLPRFWSVSLRASPTMAARPRSTSPHSAPETTGALGRLIFPGSERSPT
jgi:hypothetical protein